MYKLLAIPDTGDYLIAGYIFLSVVLVLYLVSLVLRWRRSAAEYRAYQGDFPEK